jgi:serine/threonine protein phosphatase PrpC
MEDAHMAVLGVEGASGRSSPSTSSVSPAVPDKDEKSPKAANLGAFSYFGVFDGHGGARAAEFTSEQLFQILCRDTESLKADPKQALAQAFRANEQEWLDAARQNEWMDGTTAAVALVDRSRKEGREGRCIVGNVGDSEVLLGTRLADGDPDYVILTEVHHLKRNAQETARVQGLGGRVWHGRLGHPTISPQVLSLSVSRAIGDMFFKDDTYTHGQASGLIAEPFVTTCEVCGEGVVEQFLLLACDGLWDTVSYKQANEFVFASLAKGESASVICEGLTTLARTTGSCDNITVMLAVLCRPVPDDAAAEGAPSQAAKQAE